MIKFTNINQEAPYLVFKEKYDKSIEAKQKNIEAICISSYSKRSNEVNSRYVNLKIVNDKEFIFFSNYKSPKSMDFSEHNQITGLFYWNKINVQIRLKAFIKKTSKEFNQYYFFNRDSKKKCIGNFIQSIKRD